MLVGGSRADRSRHAWKQVYRALEHGAVKKACMNQQMMKRFPKAIEDFGNKFVDMQAKRHQADYDPVIRCYKSAVLQDIADVSLVIERLEAVAMKDRRAFAAYVLFKIRSD